MSHLLLVEDDDALSRGIALSLKSSSFTRCVCLWEARAAFSRESFDLILLDVNLPDGSGLDFCREVRESSRVPIIFLTANDAEYDEVAGLEAGGDDYITKPFSLAVLRARVEAALRRAGGTASAYREGGLVFDFSCQRFEKDGEALSLSRTEQRLLSMLLENRGQTLTRGQLLEKVWDGGEFVDENTLSVAVGRLRGKVEDDPKNPSHIRTVYGIGYTWAVIEG